MIGGDWDVDDELNEFIECAKNRSDTCTLAESSL